MRLAWYRLDHNFWLTIYKNKNCQHIWLRERGERDLKEDCCNPSPKREHNTLRHVKSNSILLTRLVKFVKTLSHNMLATNCFPKKMFLLTFNNQVFHTLWEQFRLDKIWEMNGVTFEFWPPFDYIVFLRQLAKIGTSLKSSHKI